MSYTFTKLSPGCQKFVNEFAFSGQSNSKLASLCIAKAISDYLTLPSQPVNDIRNFFRMTLEIKTNSLISRINESVVINKQLVFHYVAAFYAWRYRVCFNPSNILLNEDENKTLFAFFGLNMDIDQEAFNEIKQDPFKAMRFYNGTLNLVCELNSMD